jgi:hypothetical protein
MKLGGKVFLDLKHGLGSWRFLKIYDNAPYLPRILPSVGFGIAGTSGKSAERIPPVPEQQKEQP